MLVQLNPEQRKAVEAGDGPVLIVAGPGTGKTKTLTARIAHLIQTQGVEPERILALTFTNKAAAEMRSRVAQLVPDARPHILTFHALCHELLDADTPFIADAARLQLIKSLPRPKSLKGLSARELGLAISLAKNNTESLEPDLVKVVRAYNKALAEQSLRDFDDLLLQTYQLLQDDGARQQVQERFTHILVDEFQDTNALQYQLLKCIAKHDNLFVIGDPNQSIYGFRGASGTIFEQFCADFPQPQRIVLTTNYRSAPEIVALSNSIFPASSPLIAQSDQPGEVRAVQVLNEYAEAAWVLQHIQRGIGGGDLLRVVSDDARSQHRRLSDFAVIYRSRPAALAVQRQMAESGLPYQIVGDGSPYDQPQVQAILALMRAGMTNEPIALQGYGSAQRRLLEEELGTVDEAMPSALVSKLAAILGFEPSAELQQLAGVLVRFKDVASALAHVDAIAQQGFYDAAADAITLLTIHASKGLEFPVVFVVGTEEGILPSKRGDEAEERRLLYVAATRARQQLEITHAKNRGGQPAQPSRFITELPAAVLPHLVDPDMEAQRRRIAKRVAKNSQTSLF